MSFFLEHAGRFWRDERAAGLIEYGLLSALIAVALVAILGDVADALETLFQSVIDQLTPDPAPPPAP